MIFRILIRYILGYVNISIEGYYIERFINVCISKSILLWNVKIDKSTYARANVGIKDFKKLKQTAKKTRCRVKLNTKRGLPFIMNRYRKRKIFFILLVTILVLIGLESRFVWNIEVQGLNRIPEEEIRAELAECGLNIGALKSKIETREIINKIRLKRDDIAWMNIDLKGTNIIVQIAETTQKPDIVPLDEYCNIIATKKGEITKITAKAGTPIAKIGDTVEKGSILIGGWMEGKYTGTRYVHGSRRSHSQNIL